MYYVQQYWYNIFVRGTRYILRQRTIDTHLETERTFTFLLQLELHFHVPVVRARDARRHSMGSDKNDP